MLYSCKKDYVCECSNPGGTFEAFKIHDTKKKAKQACKDYYDVNYGNIPFNETSCEIK